MSKEEKRKLKQNWVEPSPFTPMPNFDTMDTPQIKVGNLFGSPCSHYLFHDSNDRRQHCMLHLLFCITADVDKCI